MLEVSFFSGTSWSGNWQKKTPCFPKCHEKEPTHRLLVTSCPSNFQPEPCAHWLPNLWINEDPLQNSMMTRCKPGMPISANTQPLYFLNGNVACGVSGTTDLYKLLWWLCGAWKGMSLIHLCPRYECQSNNNRGIHSQMIATYIQTA
jgi:hypothetical protein